MTGNTIFGKILRFIGIVLMGLAAGILVATTRGHVDILVVLYSINVFITFVLSLLGMVRHWLRERGTNPAWGRKLAVNSVGLVFTAFILASMVVLKFGEGGWITLFVTGALMAVAGAIRRFYRRHRIHWGYTTMLWRSPHSIISFLILAFSIFVLIKGVNSLRRQKPAEPAAPPAEAPPPAA